MAELRLFKLPDVGEGLTEADIVKWHVQPGDPVRVNQIIVEIETAKAVVELPCPFDGVVGELLTAEGTTADVGTPIISVFTGADAAQAAAGPADGGSPPGEAAAGETGPGGVGAAGAGLPGGGGAGADGPVPDAVAAAVPAGSPAADMVPPAGGGAPPREERQAVLVGYGVKLGSTTRRPRKPAAGAPAAGAAAGQDAAGQDAAGEDAAGQDAAGQDAAGQDAAGQGPAPGGPAGRTAAGNPGAGLAVAPDLSSPPAPTVLVPPTALTPPPPGAAAADRSAAGLAQRPGAAAGAGAATAAGAAGARGVLAKPPVRKMARDLGIDLAGLTGSGPDGSITRQDVQEAAARPAAYPGGPGLTPAAGPAAAGLAADGTAAAAQPREERIPVRGVRKHTAAAMSASAFTAPHVTMFLQADVTETMAATARLRDMPEFEGVRVSPLLLVAKALLVAAARYPMINSAWDEAAAEIVVRHYVNLGIAAATDRGLLVPNIKDAQALPLPALARALADLAQTARAGKATPGDLSGGTITITNVGVFGVDSGTPILTPGETAILAFGQVKDAPWVHDGQLAVRKVTTVGMSFDHRIVDGDLGAAALRDIGAMLTDPVRMLALA